MSRRLISFIVSLLCCTSVFASPVYTWNGTADGDWNNAANWDASGVPVDQSAGLAGLNGDMDIIFDADGPTLNVPQLRSSNGATDGTTDMPRIQINQGTVNLQAFRDVFWKKSSTATNPNFHMLHVGDGVNSATLNLDGDTSTIELARFDQDTIPFTATVENNATLNFPDNLALTDGTGVDMQITLKGGGTLTSGALSVLAADLGTGESYIAFESDGSYTFPSGTGLSTLAEVQSYFGTVFRGIGGAVLEVTQNGSDFTVTSDSLPPPTIEPIITSFTATPSEVDPGDSVTLAWTTSNAAGLAIDQGIGDVTGLTSTQIVVNAATTFILTATNEYGSTSSSVSVSLRLYPPTSESFTATDLGGTNELVWQTTGADTLFIDNGIGDVTGMTSTQVVGSVGTSYTLTASNTDGTATASATARPPAGDSPNVVFVLVDDWGWSQHSSSRAAMGHQSSVYQTPNFDRLIDAGVAFTSAYAQQNCSPSRAALLTGQYSCRTGNGVYTVGSLDQPKNNATYTMAADQGAANVMDDEQIITIADAFKNAGYVTAHFGKYHIGPNPISHGFDFNYGGKSIGAPSSYFATDSTPPTFDGRIGEELDAFAADYDMTYISNNLIPYANGNDPTTLVGTKKHLTDALADAFISFMDAHRNVSPVYAQLHFYAVHTPLQPRPDLDTKYNGSSYSALIEGMDHSLGRVIDYLNDPNGDGNPEDSIASNTLLIFCSDNGGVQGSNAPLRGEKSGHFEGGIRIPCAISMPGTIPTNKVSDTLIHLIDFYPTMLDFAGGAHPNATTHPLDGVSLYNHLQDPDNNVRDREPIFYHHPGYKGSIAYPCSIIIKEVDGKQYKYIYSYDPYYEPFAQSDQFQLYNLTDDIGETVNLLDYIDLENTNDANDASTSEEYWNYILYKDIANQLAADLNNWLIGDPGDPTWNPIHVTYKDIYPGINPGQIGEEVAPAPASIPELEIPEAQEFQVLDSGINLSSQDLWLTFNSDSGFSYAIQSSTNLADWTIIASNITGQAGTTTYMANDPSVLTKHAQFYRAVLIGQ